jgi:hypothetical protein
MAWYCDTYLSLQMEQNVVISNCVIFHFVLPFMCSKTEHIFSVGHETSWVISHSVPPLCHPVQNSS